MEKHVRRFVVAASLFSSHVEGHNDGHLSSIINIGDQPHRRRLNYQEWNCQQLVQSGFADADGSSLSDWSIVDVPSGVLMEVPRGPPNSVSTSSYGHLQRTHVSSGPGQALSVGCLEEGRQYLLEAQIQILDVSENATDQAYKCNKYAEWLDPDFCPLFTIKANIPASADDSLVGPGGGMAKFNMGNDYPAHLLWVAGGFNPYHAVFTVDRRLAAADEALLYVRGPRPDVTIVFADVSVKPYVGSDTRFNYWTGYPPVTGTDITVTSEEFPTYSGTDPTNVKDIEYVHYGVDGEEYVTNVEPDTCTQLVVNGDAEMGVLDGWQNIHGGYLSLYDRGPGLSTQSFRNGDRVHYNSGYGQYLDVSCFQLGVLYEIKAKYRLLDENGFPYACDPTAMANAPLSMACPLWTMLLTYEIDGERKEHGHTVWNDMEVVQIAEAYNEFHGVFIATDMVMASTSMFWWFRGFRSGCDILLDDVSITEYYGDTYQSYMFQTYILPAPVEETPVAEATSCNELVTSGSSNERLTDWSIQGYDSGTLSYDGSFGYTDGRGSFKHSGRTHVNSGPGQELYLPCFEEGDQFLLTAKLYSPNLGQCDPNAAWLDVDHCAIFTIGANTTAGVAHFNMGNGNTTYQGGEWIDFHAIFTVDARLATSHSAYLYIRGVRPGATLYWDKVSMVEYVGTDTPFNEWSSPPPPEGVVEADVTSTPVETANLSYNATLELFMNSSATEEFIYYIDDLGQVQEMADMCAELVTNGDAATGNLTGWSILNQGTSELLLHPYGPNDEQASFVHVMRPTFDCGPQQFLEMECLQEGVVYEFKAKIKLINENGFPFACDVRKSWQDPLFCVLSVLQFDGGYTILFNEVQSDWVAETFNEFHAFFTATSAMVASSKVSWSLKGPRAGVQMMFDDVSIVPFQYLVESTGEYIDLYVEEPMGSVTADTVFGVSPEVDDDNWIVGGDASTGNPYVWIPEGGGLIVRHEAEERTSYKHLYRSSVLSGPSQSIEDRSFELGQRYVFRTDYRVVNAHGTPYLCTTNESNRPGSCPLFSLKVTMPNNVVKYLTSANQHDDQYASSEETAFHPYETVFTATSDLAQATEVVVVLRGLPDRHVLLFDDMYLAPYTGDTVLDVQPLQANRQNYTSTRNCEGACCDLIYMGNVSDVDTDTVEGWDAIGGGQVDIFQTPTWKAYRSNLRYHFNSGPGQALDTSCLIPGREYKVTFKIMTISPTSGHYVCDTHVWNQPGTCPIASIGYRSSDGKSHWMNAIDDKTDDTDWVPNGMNPYEAIFTVPDNFEDARDAFFIIRGPPKETAMLYDQVSVQPHEHDDTNLVVEQEERATCSSDNVCCQLVRNGDFATPVLSDDASPVAPWEAFGGGQLTYYTPQYGINHLNRAHFNSGPGQRLEHPECLVVGGQYEFRAKIRLLYPNGEVYACLDTEWRSPTVCPLFSIRYTTASGHQDYLNAYNTLPIAGWHDRAANAFQSVFTIPPAMAGLTDAYFVVRGPPMNNIIQIYEASLTPFYFVPQPDLFASNLVESTNHTDTAYGHTGPTLHTEDYNGPCEFRYDFYGASSSNLDPWYVHQGGSLSVAHGQLMVTNRVNRHMGPKHPLNPVCFELGKQFVIKTKLVLPDEENVSVYCDKLDPNEDSDCPLLSLHYLKQDGTEAWRYYRNEIDEEWRVPDWNEYMAYINVDQELADATCIAFYFERPRAGWNMHFQYVEVQEFQPVPEGNTWMPNESDDYVATSDDCSDLVANGNMEAGDTRGWSARLGGKLSLRPGGAGLTNHALQHNGRTSFVMGPSHGLPTHCLMEGARYLMDAKIKLLDEEGRPFACDKNDLWADDLACPLLTIQIENDAGERHFLYYANQAPNDWVADDWNSFHAVVEGTHQLATAATGRFFLERPRAGVTMILDEVTLSRDCSVLVRNNDGESGSTAGWFVTNGGGGEVVLSTPGADGSYRAIAHEGRTSFESGLAHALDTLCLVEGTPYKFQAKLKLLDEFQNDLPVACSKGVPWMNDLSCPIFVVTTVAADGTANPQALENEVHATWVADSFNAFEAYFTVTAAMAAAESVHVLLKGIRPGVTLVVDNFELSVDYPPLPDCGQRVIANGDFEGKVTTGWSVAHGGSIHVVTPGAHGSYHALQTVDRVHVGSGPQVTIPSLCLVEGREYEFVAQIKLQEKDGTPATCDKGANYGEEGSCPLLGIHYTLPDGATKALHPMNDDPSQWFDAQFNRYHAVFTVTSEMAHATSAHAIIKGPPAKVDILADGVVFRVYDPYLDGNCNQLLQNTGAEAGVLSFWKLHGQGYLEIIEGGYQSNHAFAHYGRTALWMGPMQNLNPGCLQEGREYEFNAMLKLLDTHGNPFACDKAAQWQSAKFCPLLSFALTMPNGEELKEHRSNNFGGMWTATAYNPFQARITVSANMAAATRVSVYLQGPAPGVAIVYDAVTMSLVSSTI